MARNQAGAASDVLDAPAHRVAEIVDGTLYTHPRPAMPHALASSALQSDLSNTFQCGRGGPGGWWIIFEPELHLGEDILVTDLAGWRRERMPDYHYFLLHRTAIIRSSATFNLRILSVDRAPLPPDLNRDTRVKRPRIFSRHTSKSSVPGSPWTVSKTTSLRPSSTASQEERPTPSLVSERSRRRPDPPGTPVTAVPARALLLPSRTPHISRLDNRFTARRTRTMIHQAFTLNRAMEISCLRSMPANE